MSADFSACGNCLTEFGGDLYFIYTDIYSFVVIHLNTNM